MIGSADGLIGATALAEARLEIFCDIFHLKTYTLRYKAHIHTYNFESFVVRFLRPQEGGANRTYCQQNQGQRCEKSETQFALIT